MHKGDVFIKYLYLAYLYLIRKVVNFVKSHKIDKFSRLSLLRKSCILLVVFMTKI